MIYTSYFAKSRQLENAGIVPISISLWPPRGWAGYTYKKLAPTQRILSEYKYNGQDENLYIQRYKEEILSKLNAEEVVEELSRISGDAENIALVCFERSGAFCHRNIVADWLRENGFACSEFF